VSTSAGDDGPDDATVSDSASSASASTSGSVDTDTSTGPVGVDDSTGDGGESTEGPVELDPDLVLWLTFDDPDAPLLDSSMYEREVSCDEATDACPVGVAGAMDLAAQFDGTNDLLQVVHDPALETDQGLTVAVRVRNDALTTLTIHTVIARPYGVATENAWELFFRDETGDGASDVVFEIADPGGQLQVLATPAVAKGEWMRIVAVWDVDTASLYFDGALQSSVATTGMLLDESPVAIGGDFDDLLPANWFVGAIDDVRVYRRALTGDEIAALP